MKITYVLATLALTTLLAARAGAVPVPVVFNVNTTVDAADFNLLDGVCDADPVAAGEQCTLRAAIQNANRTPGGAVINLPAGKYKLTLAGASEDASATGDLDITGDVTINGAGSATTIIDGNNTDRVIDIPLGATARISDLTLTHGNAVRVNKGDNGDGGGIRNYGKLFLTRCTVSHCSSGDNGGGVGSDHDSTTLVDCYIFANKAVISGGGFYVIRSNATITGCTIANNQVTTPDENGGGIYATASLAVTNSTISGNKSHGGGGGIVASVSATIKVSLVHCTVAFNRTKMETEGISTFGDGALTLANCLLYKNGLQNCSGSIQSLGGNVELGKQCAAFGAEDLNNADSKLKPLKMNGGATPTHALKKHSAAVGAGKAANCVAIDQRGQPRKTSCDAGAFETP